MLALAAQLAVLLVALALATGVYVLGSMVDVFVGLAAGVFEIGVFLGTVAGVVFVVVARFGFQLSCPLVSPNHHPPGTLRSPRHML